MKKLLVSLMFAVALSGCATTPEVGPRNVQETLIYAHALADSADVLALQLLNAGAITADQARVVEHAADVTEAAVTSGLALVAAHKEGDAEATLSAVAAALATLTTFIDAHR